MWVAFAKISTSIALSPSAHQDKSTMNVETHVMTCALMLELFARWNAPLDVTVLLVK